MTTYTYNRQHDFILTTDNMTTYTYNRLHAYIQQTT